MIRISVINGTQLFLVWDSLFMFVSFNLTTFGALKKWRIKLVVLPTVRLTIWILMRSWELSGPIFRRSIKSFGTLVKLTRGKFSKLEPFLTKLLRFLGQTRVLKTLRSREVSIMKFCKTLNTQIFSSTNPWTLDSQI